MVSSEDFCEKSGKQASGAEFDTRPGHIGNITHLYFLQVLLANHTLYLFMIFTLHKSNKIFCSGLEKSFVPGIFQRPRNFGVVCESYGWYGFQIQQENESLRDYELQVFEFCRMGGS
jgi:hypothetical protein